MERRTYLRALGATGILASAGCLESVPPADSSDAPESAWGSGETVLETPSEPRGDPIHPIHGQEFPDFSLPDPLSDETITEDVFEDGQTVLMTFFFTSCPDGACPALIQRLVQGQADAAERGYADDVTFLAMTFDPEVDTASTLETYADEMGIDLEAGNWHFLRPESEERAQEVLSPEGFGNPAQRVSMDEYEEDVEEYEDEYGDVVDTHDTGGEHEGGNESGDHEHGNESEDGDGNESEDGDGNESGDHDHDYTYLHFNLILLANPDGVVERAYPQATGVPAETILEDLQTVAEG